jgi:long-chain acyl-CoA synthetase
MGRLLGPTRLKKLVVGNLAEMSAQPEAVKGQLGAAKQLANVPTDNKHLSFHDLLDNDGIYEVYPVTDVAGTIAVLQYTGGTTGLPKAPC